MVSSSYFLNAFRNRSRLSEVYCLYNGTTKEWISQCDGRNIQEGRLRRLWEETSNYVKDHLHYQEDYLLQDWSSTTLLEFQKL